MKLPASVGGAMNAYKATNPGERVEDGTDARGTIEIQLHLFGNASEGAEVMRKDYSNHVSKSEIRSCYLSVCTSTESTAGRSRTIGFQLSPASADA